MKSKTKEFTKEKVYEKVKEITTFSTYKTIANELGAPKSFRAVAKCLRVHGCVMDENGYDVIVCEKVHCYRVINHDYSIGGYVFNGIKKSDRKKLFTFHKEKCGCDKCNR